MSEQEFEKLKLQIKEKELKSAQAKGKQESILELLKTKYGCNSIDEAKARLSEMKKENETKMKTRDEYFEKLKNLVNWETL